MKHLKTLIIGIVLVGLVIGYYFYISNKPKQEEAPQKTTNIETILLRDLDSNYPALPRDVVILYSDMMKCFYNPITEKSKEYISEKQMKQLIEQEKILFDKELLEENEEELRLDNIKKEVESFKGVKREIFAYVVADSADIELYTDPSDQREYARVEASYTIRQKEDYQKSKEEYMLRKDENGKWKILGWRLGMKEVEQQ